MKDRYGDGAASTQGPSSTVWRESHFVAGALAWRGQRESLSRRLAWMGALALTLALALSGGAISVVAYLSLRADQVRLAEQSSQVLAANVAASVASQDRMATLQMLHNFAGRTDVQSVGVRLPGGQPFVSWLRPGYVAPELPANAPAFSVSARGLVLVRPVVHQGQTLGQLVWREDFERLEATLLRLSLAGLGILALTLVTAVLALRWLQRKALAPLMALSSLTDHVARSQDYSLRATVVRPDEVGRLTERVNALLRRIEIWHEDLNDQLRQEQRTGQQFRQLAHRDTLTGLPNRRAFELELERQVVEAHQQHQRLALLFIDLDNFKQVNDTLGHAAGDEVLTVVAQRMGHVLRAADTLFRLSGDEFALLVRHVTDPHQVEHLAERLIAVVSAPLSVRSAVVPVGATVGIAYCPDNADDGPALLAAADAAMYAAKRRGKNTYCSAGA